MGECPPWAGRANLVGDRHGHVGVTAHDGAHGVDSLDDPRQYLSAGRRRDLHAVAHQEGLRDELRHSSRSPSVPKTDE